MAAAQETRQTLQAATASLLGRFVAQPLHGPRVMLLLNKLLPLGLAAAVRDGPGPLNTLLLWSSVCHKRASDSRRGLVTFTVWLLHRPKRGGGETLLVMLLHFSLTRLPCLVCFSGEAAVVALQTASETPERLWSAGMAAALGEELAHLAGQARAAQVRSFEKRSTVLCVHLER